jgi:hypothetical protein
VVAGSITMANRSVLLGGKGLYYPAEINEPAIYADKPTRVLAVVNSLGLPFYKPFLEKEGTKFETQIGGYYFYSYYVKPTTILKD